MREAEDIDEDVIPVAEDTRSAQKKAFEKEYEDGDAWLVSYRVNTNPESKPPGPTFPKEVPVIFVQDNVLHLVHVPQIEIHADSEVYQPGQEGLLVLYRKYAHEHGWWLPCQDAEEDDDEDEEEEEATEE